MSVAVLSLGTNVGDRAANINAMQEAVAKLSKTPVICSPLYESEALDVKSPQENYYNKIIRIETDESPEYLLGMTQVIEVKLGRGTKWDKAPRTADIDILLFGGLRKFTPELTLPHPRMFFRRFAIEGVKAVASDLQNPLTGELFANYSISEEILSQKMKIIS